MQINVGKPQYSVESDIINRAFDYSQMAFLLVSIDNNTKVVLQCTQLTVDFFFLRLSISLEIIL